MREHSNFVLKAFLEIGYVLACGLSVVVRACPSDAEIYHLSTSSFSKLWGRAPATCQRKLQCIDSNCFLRPRVAPETQPFLNERNMVATAKRRVQQLTPSLFASDWSDVPCPNKITAFSASRDRESDHRTDIETSRYSKRTFFHLMTHDDYSLKLSFLVPINWNKQCSQINLTLQ